MNAFMLTLGQNWLIQKYNITTEKDVTLALLQMMNLIENL